jgi:hypothetical protein
MKGMAEAFIPWACVMKVGEVTGRLLPNNLQSDLI